MKEITVKYIHPEATNLVSVNDSYKLSYVRTLCDKYKNNYKTYFIPVSGEWEVAEEKVKRTYTTKKKDKLEFGEED